MDFEEIRQMVIANLKSHKEETKFLVALMNKYPPPTPEEWAACVSAAAVQAGWPLIIKEEVLGMASQNRDKAK